MTPTTSTRSTPRGTRLRIVSAILALVVPATIWGAVSASATANDHASAGLTITTFKSTTYGTVLVSGTTVYTLKASSVACTAKCLKVWPEVLLPKGVTKATAGHGVSAAKLGTVSRAGGRLQVTYGGAALYWFSKDLAPGQIKGSVTDTWGKWTVVVTLKPSGGATTTTTTGGGAGGIGF